ncbi:hypothetical protein FXO37_32518 [Capsicum annuum]|nr:hypothetical protein FXO37_32518 [Capsicum annuum]
MQCHSASIINPRHQLTFSSSPPYPSSKFLITVLFPMATFAKLKLLFLFFFILTLFLVSQCDDQNPQVDPQEKLRECQQRCERQQKGQQKLLCKHRCEQEYKREREHQHGDLKTEEDNQGGVLSYTFSVEFICITFFFSV